MEKVKYVHDEVTHNFAAASEVLPMLFDRVKPVTLLDVGCGIGTWLKVAKDFGLKEVLGVDGHYVDRSLLKIAPSEFLEFDLQKPLRLNRVLYTHSFQSRHCGRLPLV